MIIALSLNDQYFCSSFCTSAFDDDQLWSVSSESMPKCSSSNCATVISSGIMHGSIAFVVTHMSFISLSPFVAWLCLDTQSVMNNCGPGMCGIHVLY